jgi:hypothetical protein
MESEVLENLQERRKFGVQGKTPNYSRRVVLVFVDSVDLSTFAAIRYARGLRPTSMRAVHFVVDAAHADKLREEWVLYGQDVPLEMIDTPDRRILRASAELVIREAEQPGTSVTVVLPRRSFSPLLGRLLHDRTADKIAAVVSRRPNCVATIVPFDVESRVAELHAHAAPPVTGNGTVPEHVVAGQPNGARQPSKTGQHSETGQHSGTGQSNGTGPLAKATVPAPGTTAISALSPASKAAVEGRVRAVEIRPVEHSCVFECVIDDGTGALTAMFYGRTGIPGVSPGSRLRLEGKVSLRADGPVMINPAYELVGRPDT